MKAKMAGTINMTAAVPYQKRRNESRVVLPSSPLDPHEGRNATKVTTGMSISVSPTILIQMRVKSRCP